jgi:hypothetical protein
LKRARRLLSSGVALFEARTQARRGRHGLSEEISR